MSGNELNSYLADIGRLSRGGQGRLGKTGTSWMPPLRLLVVLNHGMRRMALGGAAKAFL